MARPPGHGAGYEPRLEEIIDRAAVLFAEKGYAATGVNEIGEAVGLGKGALYYYIGSKENLLVAIQDRVLQPLMAQARRIAALDARPLVRLRLLSEELLTVILTRVDHIWVYEHDYRHLTGANLRRLLDQRREFEELVRGLLKEAIADGSLRDVDPRLATLEFLNLHNHTYQWAHTANRHWTVRELSSEYCRTLLQGMAKNTAELDGLDDEADRLRETLISEPA
ncbi:MAG TPA: TetR/AcrR family transcriptional regulator [Streptosporangiaceae bacterium]